MRRRCRLACLIVLIFGGFLAAPRAPAAAVGGVSITGRVVDLDGEPVARARLSLVPYVGSAGLDRLVLAGKTRPEAAATARSTADGGFRLEAPAPGLWKLLVEAKGYLPARADLTPALDDIDLADLLLERDTGFEIRVLDPRNRPVAGAFVLAAPDRKQPEARRRRSLRSRLDWRMGWTDEAGKIRLGRGSGEVLRVEILAPGFPPRLVEGIDAAALTVRLEPGRERTLVVRNGGEPVAGAVVEVGAFELPRGLTGEGGEIVVEVPIAANLDVEIADPFRRRAELTIEPAEKPSEEAEPVIAELIEPRHLAGRILDKKSRKPLAGAWVWIANDPAGAVRSDPRGSFSLAVSSLGIDRLWIAAASPGYLPDRVSLPLDGKEATLALDPAAVANGRVADEAGEPVAGARVAAFPRQDIRARGGFGGGRPIYAVSGPAGGFRLSPLAPGTAFDLRVAHRDFAPGRSELPPLEAGAVQGGIELRLVSGRSAQGTVLDGTGAPVAGAAITLTPRPTGTSSTRRILSRADQRRGLEIATDAEGQFAFDHLPAGEYDLAVRSLGFAPARVPGIALPEGTGLFDLGTVFLEPGAVLEGRIVDSDGEALAGAIVRAAASSGRFNLRGSHDQDSGTGIQSDEDGHFLIGDLEADGKVDVGVTLEGFATAIVPGVQVPSEKPIEIVLEPAGSLAGKVADATGKAILGASIGVFSLDSAIYRSPGLTAGPRRVSAETDEDGRFTLEGVEPGKLRLYVAAKGYVSAEDRDLEVAPGEKVEDLRLVLVQGAEVSGMVRGPDGAGLADAQVDVSRVRSSGPFGSSGSSSIGATTDAGGRYRVEGVSPGPGKATASHPSYAREVREIEVVAGDNPVDFRLERGSRITGRVVSVEGQPVPGAQIMAEAEGGSWYTAATVVTAADGAFMLEGLSDGSYKVRAEKRGFAPGGPEDSLEIIGNVDGLEIVLRRGTTLRGRILGLEFDELAKTQVHVSSNSAMLSGGGTQPDYAGEFRIGNLGPGEIRVTAMVGGAERTAQTSATIPEGALEVEVEIEFGSGLTLSGGVLQAGEPASGLQVMAIGTETGGSGFGTTDHEGRFSLKDLQPGHHRILVGLPGTGSVRHTEEIDLQTDREMLIELSSAAVAGRVIHRRDRTAVERASVTLRRVGDGTRDVFATAIGAISGTRTDQEGRFEFSSVPDGTYVVAASREGFGAVQTTLQIDAGVGVSNLEIEIEPVEGLTLEVFSSAGGRPTNVWVAALDSAGWTVLFGNHTVGEGGRVHLSSLPPGRWEILVGAQGLATATLVAEAPGEPVRVALQPGATLEISVPELGASGPLATVRAVDGRGRPYRRSFGGPVLEELPMMAGRGVLDSLAAGEWTVTVTVPDGRSWSKTVSLAAGQRTEMVLP